MKVLFACLTLVSMSLSYTFAQSTETVNTATPSMPIIIPTPFSVEPGPGSVILGKSVVVLAAPNTGQETVDLVHSILKRSGVETIESGKDLPSSLDRTYIILGTGNDKLVQSALNQSGTQLQSHAEGYTLICKAVGQGALITLAGNDATGLFYAAQTFRQLAQREVIPSLLIQDHPAMPIRGTIEGFYGKPWTTEERKNHLNFLATLKANTYVYTPKDDPYARDRWREPYPENILNELKSLVTIALQNHINFVYAISPGPTICFSDKADLQALESKFKALRSIGVHNFYVALDDIEYAKWNCDKDKEVYGPSGTEAAGMAQSKLLNELQANLDKADPDADPLIMVPTEYYDAKESPYKNMLIKNLDPRIVIQWTGTDVVPPSISVGDAKRATKAFGRKTLLWDNYPVNDFAQTAGRLLLAPYKRREAGLSEELSGILSNPMNQEAASRVAVTGVVAFAWNDKGYDADLTWHASARDLSGGDSEAAQALIKFFDTQHMAPTFGSQPWQEQAPALKAVLDKVREGIALGTPEVRKQSVEHLAELATEFAKAPEIIRSRTVDPNFINESEPWLNAMLLWGKALQATAAGLQAAEQGNTSAHQHFEEAKQLADKASKIQSTPGANRIEGPVKIADGVLDKFIADAPKLIIVNAKK